MKLQTTTLFLICLIPFLVRAQITTNFSNCFSIDYTSQCWEFSGMELIEHPTLGCAVQSEPLQEHHERKAVLTTPTYEFTASSKVSFSYGFTNNSSKPSIYVYAVSEDGTKEYVLGVATYFNKEIWTSSFNWPEYIMPGAYKIAFVAVGKDGNTNAILDNISIAKATLVPKDCGGSSFQAPAALLNFNGEKEGGAVFLDWEVSSLNQIKQFVLEKSTNGENYAAFQETFPSDQLKFKAKDIAPFRGTSFYRLKMIFQDDSFEYSAIVAINHSRGARTSIFVSPNPASNFLSFKNLDSTLLQIEISDLSGRLQLKQSNLDPYSRIPINQLDNGLYIARIQTVAGWQTLKFTKG